jgi:hypothetical protein
VGEAHSLPSRHQGRRLGHHLPVEGQVLVGLGREGGKGGGAGGGRGREGGRRGRREGGREGGKEGGREGAYLVVLQVAQVREVGLNRKVEQFPGEGPLMSAE